MARIYTDTWVEEHQCVGFLATVYLNGDRFDRALWADPEAGEIGALSLCADGRIMFDEESGEAVISIVQGKVDLVWPAKDKQSAGC